MSCPTLDMQACANTTELVAGRYQIESFVSEGNFGAVYRATHWAYGHVLRKVALKVAKQKMTDAEARKAFGDGLQMAKVQDAAPAHLRDRFVTVYDAGTCSGGIFDGRPYVAMEPMERSLKRALEDLTDERFTLDRAVATFDQILETMGCMHRLGYIHRDLKPSNILVTRGAAADRIKVTDFGLVQEVDTILGWTDSAGDLAHLAPEAFEENIGSREGDVYMLGLIFYEMLTGENPFAGVSGKGDELRERHRDARRAERFQLLEKYGPTELIAVVRKSLDYDWRRRYDDAGAMHLAWEKARGRAGAGPVVCASAATPLEKFRAAERAGLPGEGEPLLAEVMQWNRNAPRDQVIGEAYLCQVQILLDRGELEKAWDVAWEGGQKRKCASTLKAKAAFYKETDDPNRASRHYAEAETCEDQS